MRLRILSSGIKVAPHRGKPPACPDGYIRSQGDPYVFNPIVQECGHRSEKRIPQKCCHNDRIIMWCTKHNKEITALKCMECKINEN